jgi:hypothetical protein
MNAARHIFGGNTANEIEALSTSMELHGSSFASYLPDAVLFIKTPTGPRGTSHPVKISARFFKSGEGMNRKTADDQGHSRDETA